MKNWKLKPPVCPEQKALNTRRKESLQREQKLSFIETLNTERRKEQGQDPFMGTDKDINGL